MTNNGTVRTVGCGSQDVVLGDSLIAESSLAGLTDEELISLVAPAIDAILNSAAV